MNAEEWQKWLRDARTSLLCKYSETEVDVIIAWFNSIKTSAEIDLVGEEEVQAMKTFVSGPHFNVYDSMMCRLWIYAPYILKGKHAQN